MVSKLPAFGDVSGICSEDNSLHENITLINEGGSGTTLPVQVDSQETVFNDSQSQQEQEHTEDSVDENYNDENDEDVNGNRMEIEDTVAAADVSKNIKEPPSKDVEDDFEEDELLPEEDSPETNEVDPGAADESEGVNADNEQEEKVFQLPFAKIKRIMKTDPDLKLFGKEAVVAVAICTENFVSMLAQQCQKLAVRTKKKRITLEHLKSTITSSPTCDFLEGTLPEFDI